MAKTLTPEYKAYLGLGSQTTSRQWRFQRTDGFVITVTTCSRDLLINGEIYRTKNGVNPTAISQEATAAVANSEVNGAMAADSVNEAELFAGLWDGAFVTVFEVNYRDLTMGVLNLQSGNIGDVKAGRTAFTAEVRGLTQSLQKIIGRVYTAACPWKFGSISPDAFTPACNKALGPLTVTGALTSFTDLRTFVDTMRSEGADYFGAGVITFTGGANNGVKLEIYSYDSTTKTFVTHLPLPYNPAQGDTYSLTPGCRKRYTEDCRTKWANTNNHGGFPDIPGSDVILGQGGT